MIFSTALQISSGLAFLSFLAALGLAAYRIKLRSQLDQFKSLPPSERAGASSKVLNSFGIDASTLSKEQRFLLAIKELEGRDSRYKYTLFATAAIILASIGVAAFSFSSESGRKSADSNAKIGADNTTLVKYRLCRLPEFGQEGWRNSQDYTDTSDREDGGHDQNWWCNQVANNFIRVRFIGSPNSVDHISSSEESDKDWKGHVTYKYHCTIRVKWDPIYVEKRDERCGVEN